jgi:phage shock protein A
MSLFARLALIFKSKAHKQLDKHENPNEMLDYSYERQRELVAKMRRGLAEVATARKRIEMQVQTMQKQADTLTAQAEKAIAVGREDLAREALTRKAALVPQLEDLKTQHANVLAEEEKLTVGMQKLQAKVDAFATKKETIKAQYTAAQAQTQIAESFSGISTEMADMGNAIQRAEDKTLQLQARGSAIDELMESGAFDDASGLGGDSISRELDALSASSAVEDELARMRNELSGPTAPRELR